jgi:hypothetical protein
VQHIHKLPLQVGEVLRDEEVTSQNLVILSAENYGFRQLLVEPLAENFLLPHEHAILDLRDIGLIAFSQSSLIDR